MQVYSQPMSTARQPFGKVHASRLRRSPYYVKLKFSLQVSKNMSPVLRGYMIGTFGAADPFLTGLVITEKMTRHVGQTFTKPRVTSVID